MIFLKETPDQIDSLKSLEVEWRLKRNLLRVKLIRSKTYNIYYQKMLMSIDDFFPLRELSSDNNMIWMRYLILERFANKKLLDCLVKECIGDEMLELNMLAINLLE